MADASAHKFSGTNGTSAAPLPKSLEKVLAMTKGAGEDSYSKNSGPQADVVGNHVLPALGIALERLILPAHGPVVVADLGCASGLNSISEVSFIVEKLRARFLDSASPTVPEFQVFFNDLPSNDFNNLFELLSASEKKQDFFAGGVPGSFYGRLFPYSSVHVFFSFSALHWLSKIPDAVLDKSSPAYNKGKVWVNGSSPEVGAAYKEQASSDLKNFLNARAAELVPGGLLFFFIMGRSYPEPHKQIEPTVPSGFEPALGSLNEACWNDLISVGIVTEEQRDNFNIPIFGRTLEEVMEGIESCRSSFDVVMTKMLFPNTNLACLFRTVEPVELSTKITGFTKSFTNSLLEEIVGKEAADVYWRHFQKIALKNGVPVISAHLQIQEARDRLHVVALVRK